MIKQLLSMFLLALSGVLLAPSLTAQESKPDQPPTAALEVIVPEEEVPASQEVEINEDNYRQFMELKDPNLQREIIPENVFKPGSGLQKLEKLPEESQKHLRNQLREIIVQGDPWQPGDEETEYPYTPSMAAGKDASLEKQELEAWGELVDSYHDRESQIYENSSGSQAARGSEQGSSDSQQNGTGASGPTGQGDEGSQGQQAGQEEKADQSEIEGTYSMSGLSDSSANSTAGVSQNAMQFLQGLGKSTDGVGKTAQVGSAKNAAEGNAPTPADAESRVQNSQAGGTGNGGMQREPGSPEPGGGTEGTSQNAMEFLQGLANADETAGEGNTKNSTPADGDENSPSRSEGQSQSGQPTVPAEQATALLGPLDTPPLSSAQAEEESTVGASQNALEYLTGESAHGEEDPDAAHGDTQDDGTLSIQDLLNARGTGNATNSAPLSPESLEGQQADENVTDKDKDG